MGNEAIRLFAYSLGGIIVAECLLLIGVFWSDHFRGRRQLRSARPAMAVLVLYALVDVGPNTLLVIRAGNADSLSSGDMTLILMVMTVKALLVVGLGTLIVEFRKRLRGDRLIDGTTTSEVFEGGGA